MCFCVQARGAIPIATRGHCRKATEGWIKQISVFRFHLSVCHMQLAVPKVVAIAVRMVITMLRILPQVVLLLKVPIVVSLRLKVIGERMSG